MWGCCCVRGREGMRGGGMWGRITTTRMTRLQRMSRFGVRWRIGGGCECVMRWRDVNRLWLCGMTGRMVGVMGVRWGRVGSTTTYLRMVRRGRIGIRLRGTCRTRARCTDAPRVDDVGRRRDTTQAHHAVDLPSGTLPYQPKEPFRQKKIPNNASASLPPAPRVMIGEGGVPPDAPTGGHTPAREDRRGRLHAPHPHPRHTRRA